MHRCRTKTFIGRPPERKAEGITYSHRLPIVPIVGMTPVFQNSSTRSLFLVDILMSVALGLVVIGPNER